MFWGNLSNNCILDTEMVIVNRRRNTIVVRLRLTWKHDRRYGGCKEKRNTVKGGSHHFGKERREIRYSSDGIITSTSGFSTDRRYTDNWSGNRREINYLDLTYSFSGSSLLYQ